MEQLIKSNSFKAGSYVQFSIETWLRDLTSEGRIVQVAMTTIDRGEKQYVLVTAVIDQFPAFTIYTEKDKQTATSPTCCGADSV
jgi:hypothetical protein